MRKLVNPVTCDWCTKEEDFDTEESVLDEGWFQLSTQEEELDFCSVECLIAYL